MDGTRVVSHEERMFFDNAEVKKFYGAFVFKSIISSYFKIKIAGKKPYLYM
ncbi:MAG: hypothetical protein ACTSXF_07235 [Promethearchaeota archaeon]